jgi:signal transduction histidine kinase
MMRPNWIFPMSQRVLGNETQLRQVLTNVLENVLKFIPAGGWISLRREPSGMRG